MTLSTLSSAPALADNPSLEEARRALAELHQADDPNAARETLRRALFHDRLPSVDMAGDAYLALREGLLPAADDDFARRCDVVAVVMVARAEGRLRSALEGLLHRSLQAMDEAVRPSAARWLLGQLFDEGAPRVELADAGQTERRLHAAAG